MLAYLRQLNARCQPLVPGDPNIQDKVEALTDSCLEKLEECEIGFDELSLPAWVTWDDIQAKLERSAAHELRECLKDSGRDDNNEETRVAAALLLAVSAPIADGLRLRRWLWRRLTMRDSSVKVLKLFVEYSFWQQYNAKVALSQLKRQYPVDVQFSPSPAIIVIRQMANRALGSLRNVPFVAVRALRLQHMRLVVNSLVVAVLVLTESVPQTRDLRRLVGTWQPPMGVLLPALKSGFTATPRSGDPDDASSATIPRVFPARPPVAPPDVPFTPVDPPPPESIPPGPSAGTGDHAPGAVVLASLPGARTDRDATPDATAGAQETLASRRNVPTSAAIDRDVVIVRFEVTVTRGAGQLPCSLVGPTTLVGASASAPGYAVQVHADGNQRELSVSSDTGVPVLHTLTGKEPIRFTFLAPRAALIKLEVTGCAPAVFLRVPSKPE